MRITIYFVSLCLMTTSAFCGEWIADKQNGCKVWNEQPAPGESITWTGGCEGGKANGKGILQLYKNNKKESKNEGEFKDGKMNGHGTKTFPDGTIYKGEFKEGNRNGHGTVNFPDGTIYEGEFKEGELNGHGTVNFPNGSKYEGEFKDGRRNGHGTATSPNGDRFTGAFSNDQRHGQGTFTYKDGTSYKGLWEHGEKIKIF